MASLSADHHHPCIGVRLCGLAQWRLANYQVSLWRHGAGPVVLDDHANVGSVDQQSPG